MKKALNAAPLSKNHQALQSGFKMLNLRDKKTTSSYTTKTGVLDADAYQEYCFSIRPRPCPAIIEVA